MKAVLFDTSVLVAAIIQEHPRHLPSRHALERVRRKELQGWLVTHTLAECYSALTSIAVPLLVPSEVREVILGVIRPLFDFIPLTESDYADTLDRIADVKLRGGVIYDALTLQGAFQKKISTVVTWNVKHFARFATPELQVITPEDLKT
ncbi:MAG: PIN domain-containing protein [Deltaproteobacteria bacterium]|nr:PIN domain-containing protein [Deltaproteobacteria bacterium]